MPKYFLNLGVSDVFDDLFFDVDIANGSLYSCSQKLVENYDLCRRYRISFKCSASGMICVKVCNKKVFVEYVRETLHRTLRKSNQFLKSVLTSGH